MKQSYARPALALADGYADTAKVPVGKVRLSGPQRHALWLLAHASLQQDAGHGDGWASRYGHPAPYDALIDWGFAEFERPDLSDPDDHGRYAIKPRGMLWLFDLAQHRDIYFALGPRSRRP